ncbi:ferredoxin-thioredoxin reductase catalytic chain, chloroplastic-like [Camellia sinensis]|uniref:ferredoxin-thioredoxin reductase catalytic chain, chloroplastic-like n=1 Tax=Camellia sinensis TaxID=4442 RepID=UPI0010362B1F|nr:ferredoxin-thioredoxin reductase catalytic chain, chloroplastic-like [Camellia sinensis]
MTALQASTSYGVGISTFVTSPRLRLHHRHVITAQVEPSDKSVEIMRKFSEQYARKSGTYFCVDKGVTSVVIKVFFIYFLWIDYFVFFSLISLKFVLSKL